MRVLLTNDDGVYAEGIQALGRVLEKEPGIEAVIVAPERERSASGHAITLHKPLHVNKVDIQGINLPCWSVSGTPADCTKIGVLSLLSERPDMVVSGINRGANVGMDVLYSGTVSAAIEGYILGIPSVAVSLAAWDEADYTFAAAFTARLLRKIAAANLGAGVLFNVNIPPLEAEKVAGVAVTRLGVRYYNDVFHPRRDPRGRTYYWLAGEPRRGETDKETDIGALQQNLISITPLQLNLTHLQAMESLKEWIPEMEDWF